ncbi:hypothetical protein K7574_21090 (plasmid) [Stenotrophomonas maltophilia]|uniref:hypothetical protein n=1 Tax=Stenotrophomonas maltophilia TaxID=40324 RepID=UPI001D0C3A5F|nr:hypothetical protein [Stenotrophomonas maltophilia]UXF74705.1 hypothetical protein K7574_21090 [Stenotrophomonas maltophilia]
MSKWKIKAVKVPASVASLLPVLARCADWFERKLRQLYSSMRDRISPPVSVLVKKGRITIAESVRAGGRVHILEVQPNRVHPLSTIQLQANVLQVGPSTIPYADAALAALAYAQVRKAVLPATWSAWILRLVGLVAVVLILRLATVALLGSPAGNAAGGSELEGVTAQMAADPGFFPPAPAPQPLPGASELFGSASPAGSGDLADQIYQQARAAAAQTEHATMPPQPSVNVEGLAGFGLEEGGDQAGPGCDPNLAFKVEQ